MHDASIMLFILAVAVGSILIGVGLGFLITKTQWFRDRVAEEARYNALIRRIEKELGISDECE